MKRIFILVLLLCPLLVFSATLRLEGDRAWLTADGVPLAKVLRLFEQRGVEVLIDPSLELGRVSGEWESTKLDRLIGQLVSPNSYLLEWRRVDSPLGKLYQVASIRIFSDGNSAAAQPLEKKRTGLDVVEGKDGLKYIRGEILVGFGEGSDIDVLNALLRKLGGTVVEVIDPPGIYRIKLNEGMSVEEAMRIAKGHGGVDAVEPNLAFKRIGGESVPWLGSGAGINLNLQPGETAVAVFDSGFDPKYADLPFIRGTYNALDPSKAISDPLGHGTLTAMVASGAITPLGAEASEVGVPVLAVRTFDENGYTSSDILMRAFEYAIDSGVKIVSMSWGSEVDSAFMEAAMGYAAQHGITLYASAGNEPIQSRIYPAGSDFVIAVGGLNPDGTRWENSNYGDHIEVYEPAKVVFDGNAYEGTSVSAPLAARKKAQKN